MTNKYHSAHLDGPKTQGYLLRMVLVLLSQLALAGCGENLNPTESTHRYYDGNAERYAQKHDHLSAKLVEHHATFRRLLPKPGPEGTVAIVDLGAGHGRDAKLFMDDGYEVIPVEPSAAMAQKILEKTGVAAVQQFAQELNLNIQVDGMWVMTSLIHVPVEQLPEVFRRIHATLKEGGVAFVSVTAGTGATDVPNTLPDGRYFNNVSGTTLRRLVMEQGGFEVLEELSGFQKDDFHGGKGPTQEFGFFNLYLKKKSLN